MRSLERVDDLLELTAAHLKVGVQVERSTGRRQDDDVAGLCGGAGQLHSVLHVVGVLDGQRCFVKAFAFAHSLLDTGAGGTHQHQVLDVGNDFRCQRLIRDVLVVAARNEDDLLVEAAQARNGAGGAGTDGVVVVQHVDVVRKLAKPFQFVRVDLYMANDHIYFGELTFTDGAGSDPFTPRSFDLEMAKRIKLGRVLQEK